MFKEERERLVQHLLAEGYICHDAVRDAFLHIPREEFLPASLKALAYHDTPLEIGNGQTISAPHMVAIMCEALDIHQGQNILEIGAGSGYHAAIVSLLVGKKGKVFTIERFPDLAARARENLKRAGLTNVTVELGDGSKGLEAYQPYDRIYVTCAAPSIPDPLVAQLQVPGKLLIPVGRMYCELLLVEKKNNNITTQNHGGCVFVPLVGKYGH